MSHDKGECWQNTMKEKDKNSDRDWSSSSKRRCRDDREVEFNKDIPREKDMGHDNGWEERRHQDNRSVSRDKDMERDCDRDQEHFKDYDGDRDQDRERD